MRSLSARPSPCPGPAAGPARRTVPRGSTALAAAGGLGLAGCADQLRTDDRDGAAGGSPPAGLSPVGHRLAAAAAGGLPQRKAQA